MNIFIDDSGSFSWTRKGVSLFGGLIVPDREMTDLSKRFVSWKRSIIGASARELKGEELTSSQLESFSYKVLPPTTREVYLTVVGADTRLTSELLIKQCCEQVSKQCLRAAALVLEHNPKNKRLSRQYAEMSGWIRNRSTVNYLWLHALEEVILQTIQHSVVYFLEPEDESEFENIEVTIDRSFIHREEHIAFWKEWLRNGLVNRSHRRRGFITPNTWRQTAHPFYKKYWNDGLFNFRDLFRDHMKFADSKASAGLQVADICAHICYRFYRGEKELNAYHGLLPRIVGEGGRTMTVIHFNDQSLIKDAIENHVGIMDVEAMKQAAAKREAKVSAGSHPGEEFQRLPTNSRR